jgi:hypothetical protein
MRMPLTRGCVLFVCMLGVVVMELSWVTIRVREAPVSTLIFMQPPHRSSVEADVTQVWAPKATNVSENVPEDVPEDAPVNVSANASMNASEDVLSDVSEHISDDSWEDEPDVSAAAELGSVLLPNRTFLERDDENVDFNNEPCRKRTVHRNITTNMPADKAITDELSIKGGDLFGAEKLATLLAGHGKPFLDAYLPIPWDISSLKHSWNARYAIGSTRPRDDKCVPDPGKKILLYNAHRAGK